jgi:hypothetical protein
MISKKYDTPEKCKRILMLVSNNDFVCYNCKSIEYYKGIDYEKICKECKAKTSITRSTMFHNVRFGIVKAFGIADAYYKSGYTLSSYHVAKNYGITQKTSWIYLKKIVENKNYVEMIFSTKREGVSISLDDVHKLQMFLDMESARKKIE